jgi:hypothetical protein
LLQEIEKRPALRERWIELERNALQKGNWGFTAINQIDESNEQVSVRVVHSWSLAGNRPQDYVYGKDDKVCYEGRKTSYLKALETARGATNDFGTLMLSIDAENYRKKRLRFSAAVKSEGIQGWAGLWMRVDGIQKGPTLSFDNMEDRPIQGTTDWQNYAIVLDVPEESMNISFGILLTGKGQLWFNAPHLEEVGDDVPAHNMPIINPNWKEESTDK